VIAIGNTEPGFEFTAGTEIFFSPPTHTGSTQPLIAVVKMITQRRLMLRLRMCGAVPPSCSMSPEGDDGGATSRCAGLLRIYWITTHGQPTRGGPPAYSFHEISQVSSIFPQSLPFSYLSAVFFLFPYLNKTLRFPYPSKCPTDPHLFWFNHPMSVR
jgi:hypothetical protein